MAEFGTLLESTLKSAGRAFRDFARDNLRGYLELRAKLDQGEALTDADLSNLGYSQRGQMDITLQLQVTQERQRSISVGGSAGFGPVALQAGFAQTSRDTEQSSLTARFYADYAIQLGVIEKLLERAPDLVPLPPVTGGATPTIVIPAVPEKTKKADKSADA